MISDSTEGTGTYSFRILAVLQLKRLKENQRQPEYPSQPSRY